MANPLTAADFIEAGKRIEALGVTVKYMPDWKTNCRCHSGAHNGTTNLARAWGKTNFFALHHPGGADDVDANAHTDAYVQFLAHRGQGNAVPGPLCTHFLDEEGGKPLLWILSMGRTNNFGNIAANALAAAQNSTLPLDKNFRPGPDSLDGNAHCIGMEVSEDGRGVWKPSKYWAAVIIVAEFLRQLGWNTPDVLGHKEGTIRKSDPSFNMGEFRKYVKAHLDKPRTLASYLGSEDKATTPVVSRPKVSLTKPTWDEVHAVDTKVADCLRSAGVIDIPTTLRGRIQKFQQLQGWSGSDADGLPGTKTLDILGFDSKA